MKALFVVAVISCIFLVASARTCVERTADNTNCVSLLTTALGTNSTSAKFCDDCGNTLVSYYQDCFSGVGVNNVKRCECMHVFFFVL